MSGTHEYVCCFWDVGRDTLAAAKDSHRMVATHILPPQHGHARTHTHTTTNPMHQTPHHLCRVEDAQHPQHRNAKPRFLTARGGGTE